VRDSRKPNDTANDYGLVRTGGFAILIGLAIHIVLNFVLKAFPPADATKNELQAYLIAQDETWAIVHGCRYVAFFCIALFGAGIFVRTACRNRSRWNPWGVVGLLGCALMLANAIITNGIEILAFYDFSRLSEEPSLFYAFFHATRVLFTGEIATWSIFIFGFSMAGWCSSTIPKWIAVLGFVAAAAQLLSATLVVTILSDGWATPVIEVASIGGLAWFLCTGVYMSWRGSSSQEHDHDCT